ncbi:MAG: hypothetical protein AAFV62_00175 [Pseudomonadota bacterium]
MDMIADGLTIAAALAAVFYCWSLNRKLAALKDTDQGLGASIKTLAETVEKARTTLAEAKTNAREEQSRLASLIAQARELELKADRFEFRSRERAAERAAERQVERQVERKTERGERKFHKVFATEQGTH